jgi:murein DD-endopeptidase MepM/ murein hydrolase activator NlpD
MIPRTWLAAARRAALGVTFMLEAIRGTAALAHQIPPLIPGSEPPPFDSPEVERFKRLLATGGIDRRPKAAPDKFLPSGNKRSSEPGVTRVYKKGPDGKFLKPQPEGYPKTIDPKTYQKADDEGVRVHEGFDLTSRDAKGKPVRQDFKAGVYGKIVEVGTSNALGRIVVEVDERKNRVEYLHTSKTFVKVGDDVNPETRLGMTGDTGAGAIHLHVQARNAKKEAINPDEVVLYATKPPPTRKEVPLFAPMKWEVPPLSDADFAPNTPLP